MTVCLSMVQSHVTETFHINFSKCDNFKVMMEGRACCEYNLYYYLSLEYENLFTPEFLGFSLKSKEA